MTWGKSLLLAIPLILGGILVVDSPSGAATQVGAAGAWAGVSAGGDHTCAISTGRSLYCWGDNDDGQIGDGTTTNRPSPRKIGSAGVWAGVSAGGDHTCAISTGRSLYCWGDNNDGQIGDGTTTDNRPSPRRIGAAGAWTTVGAGGTHTCAITTGRSLYCWGDNDDGQIGDGTTTNNRPSPRRIGAAGAWTTVGAGEAHTCAVSTARSLYCWGDNEREQVQEGSATSPLPSPRRIGAAGVWGTVTAGGTRTCAISTGRSLYCWGGYPPAGSKLPAEILDLSHWKLQTPVDTDVAGNPDEIKYGGSPDLASFTNSEYFHSNAASTAVYFRARVDGVTTSGSDYPRSELREMKSNGSTNAAWSNATGMHRMTIRQAITRLPEAKPHVVAGQIHGGPESDMLQIRLEGSRLLVRFEGDSDHDQTLNSNYQLGTMFTVDIRADASGISVDYDDVRGVTEQVSHNVVASAPTWYFKAGCYTQSNDSVEDEPDEAYGEVLIDSLTISPVT